MSVTDYLQTCMPTKDQVDRFVKSPPKGEIDPNKGWHYSRELGWLLRDSVRKDGWKGAKTFYHYDDDGARRVIQHRGEPCRIHTYGDSFTHGDQVSDGETYQEFLAAHIGEPVKNFGIGGYSVYQAYLRMRLVEAVDPAPFIVLNIWADDHFRNLDAWRSLRFGKRSPCGFPLPHLRVNVEKGECIEQENPARSAEDLYRLCEPGFVEERYREDPVLQMVTAKAGEQTDDAVPVSFGLPTGNADLQKIHAEAALFATQNVVQWADQFCNENGKKLFLILSHGAGGIRKRIDGEPDWDRSFLDFLKARSLPLVDLRDAHAAEFETFDGEVDAYLKRYYIGHYNPAGNFFEAHAVKEKLIEWLDPKPPAFTPLENG